MHDQFKYQPERRCNSSSASSSLLSKQHHSSSDTAAAKVRKRTRQRQDDGDDSRALSAAYFSLLLFACLVVVVLVGDDFFTQLYNNMVFDATSPADLPASFHPLTYDDCLVDESLLSLHILTPDDEELTANPSVSMTVTGQFFRADSSHHQRREAFVRVRLDDHEDINFPGGNNMTIPLDDSSFDLTFDLSYFGFGSKRGPFKLTVEIFIPVLPTDVHYADCERANKNTLTSAHTVYFFYFPIEEPDTVQPDKHAPQHLKQKQPIELSVADSQDNGVRGAEALAMEAISDMGTGEVAQDWPELVSVTVAGADAVPGFRFTKMLSLAYAGGCTGPGADNTGSLRLGISLHPQVLARAHLGSQQCVHQFLSTGHTAAECTPAVFVLSYMGSNYDISTHIRSESAEFTSSPSMRLLKGISNVDLLKMRPVDNLLVVLEEVARRQESSSHLLQVYMCAGGSGARTDREQQVEEDDVMEQQRLHACTQAPLVWDALLVQCDATPQAHSTRH